MQLALERHSEIFNLDIRHFEVRVPRDAKLVALSDAHAWEKFIDIGVDHGREKNEVISLRQNVLRHFNQPWQRTRSWNDRKAAVAAECIFAVQ